MSFLISARSRVLNSRSLNRVCEGRGPLTSGGRISNPQVQPKLARAIGLQRLMPTPRAREKVITRAFNDSELNLPSKGRSRTPTDP